MTSTPLQAVLWDMDGTIVDTEPFWMAAEMDLVARFGGTWSAGQATGLVGLGLHDAATVLQGAGVELSPDQIIGELTGAVMDRLRRQGAPYRPGAVELLGELRGSGVKTALVTMSMRAMADAVVATLPDGTFDAVIAGDDVARPKPFPDPYLTACAALDVDPAYCVAIEDSPNGARSAVAAGAATIGVPHIVPLDDTGVHEIWSTLAGRTLTDLADVLSASRQVDVVSDPLRPSGPFRIGDRVQLTGPKGKLQTITLRERGELHTHHGVLRHDSIVGQPDGSVVVGSGGHEYLALRPLLRDFVMSMPRGAAIVYPKDAAQILADADIFPGARVIEAGVGSGALSLWLLRAIGEAGSLVSFERREEFAEVARANVETFFGQVPERWRIQVGDLAEELPTAVVAGSVDRVVLDMLAPWECIDAVADALAPGGVVICYVATATQLSRVAEYLRGTGLFTDPVASETMVRGWHVEGLAVRPDHRMVAHTGFLISARRLAPGAVPPDVRKRALKKPSYSDADTEAWTPGAVGDREITDKNLRKRVREAQRAAEGAREAAAEGRASESATPTTGT